MTQPRNRDSKPKNFAPSATPACTIMSSTDEGPAQGDGDVAGVFGGGDEMRDERDPAIQVVVMESQLKELNEKKGRTHHSETEKYSAIVLEIRQLEIKIAKVKQQMENEAKRREKNQEREQKKIDYFRQAATIDLLKSRRSSKALIRNGGFLVSIAKRL